MTDFFNLLPMPIVSIIGFLITILFLVAIHEYGHFWMARRFGVKIEKFSIGFGKPIVKWYGKRDNTEYSISWIPLGGYVKMYGETATSSAHSSQGDVSNQAHDISDISDIHSAKTGSFIDLSPFKRLLIAFAGPAINLIFAVLALWLLFVIGIPQINPYLGTIKPDSPFYQTDIRSGDKITTINDSHIDSLTDAVMHLVDNIDNPNTNITSIDKEGTTHQATLDLSQLPSGSEMHIEKALGLNWGISEAGDNQAAQVQSVVKGSPAQQAGFAIDDVILRINQTPINNWQNFTQMVRANPNKPLNVWVKRQNQEKTLNLTPGQHPNDANVGYAGISPKVDPHLFDPYIGLKRYGIVESLPMAIKENYFQGRLILKTFWRLIVGQASIKNIGGPITIADYAGKSLQMGYVTYLKFLAAISLTLAIMNLIPIPVLDGGHIALCAIEMVRGKPLSAKMADILLRIGGAILMTFIIFVVGLDIWKHVQ